ncbi:VOC family protein [Anaeromyxobacter dehalogenans]|uniref:Glyoxalase/bleomycin resistance protein/dioxygenase n=1 Tax=Anaeromyxobacter dehalogenans (strain 2CP-C) TaxID=290397 RepID=Q2INC5_ANADE|nr:VOC family protein [Anaeromyxobacter dehalogenans]ABC80305.1 Glyoxalase/bleomycin resistance protein/dioxygenase [Anaeromyxobacter dehalogenans 2CP-C]
MPAVKHIPDGYQALTPYLVMKDAARAIDFYRQVFGAVELMRMPGPEGRVGHAELKIGDARLMLADEHPEMGALGPKSIGGTAVGLVVYVPDVDATVARAVAAGATVKGAVEDKFYGDRMGSIVDPFGHLWHVGTHKEDVSPEEMQRRMAALPSM